MQRHVVSPFPRLDFIFIFSPEGEKLFGLSVPVFRQLLLCCLGRLEAAIYLKLKRFELTVHLFIHFILHLSDLFFLHLVKLLLGVLYLHDLFSECPQVDFLRLDALFVVLEVFRKLLKVDAHLDNLFFHNGLL